MKSILFLIILLISTFSISDAFEKMYKLPNNSQEYKLFCQMKSKDQIQLDFCIERQKKVLKSIWIIDTQKEAEEIQGFFSFCIGTNRTRIKQSVDRNGIYSELWAWSPEATFDCLTKMDEIKKKKKGEGDKEGKLKGEPQPGRGYGNSDPNAGTI